MAFDGSDVRRLTANDTDDVYPSWSPDGTKIVFQSYRDGQPEIYVMNAGGGGQARLTAFDGYDGQPVWSPDGQWIAFVSARSGDWRLYRMDATGAQVQLVPTPVEADTPVWSPDGTMLAFSGDGNGDGWWDLWTMNVDGSGAVMREASGSSRELVPWSWVRRMPTDIVTLTDIGLVYYEGAWYWTNASLNAYYMPREGYLSDIVLSLLPGVSEAWHPDIVSMDREPPQPFSLDWVAPLQPARIGFDLPEFVDTGGSGVWGYEWGWQYYPSGSWGEGWMGGDYRWIEYEPDAGEATRMRVRVWDAAGNATRWEYTPPLTVFENELLSRVVDNRGLGVPDVTIDSTPGSFLEVYDGEGGYHGYTAVPLDGGAGTIDWSHSGFGSPATRSFSGWPDWGRFEFDVVLPPAGDVITNGDFGTGNLSGWDVEGPVAAAEQFASFTGTDAMALSQTVTIPGDALNATLAFRYVYGAWGDPLPFTVDLIDDEGEPARLATITTNTDWEFVQTWVDVSAWAGETVTVRFARATGYGSEAALDDVSLGSAYPDVWVRQHGQPVADRGETVVLRLDYGNRSGLSAPESVVTYALPAALALVAAEPAPTSTAPLTWELGELAAEMQGSIVLTATVSTTPTGGLVSAPATIATPHEAITGNNTTSLAVWVGGRVFLPVMTGD